MKRFLLILSLLGLTTGAWAEDTSLITEQTTGALADNTNLITEQTIQSRIDDTASRILNANQIKERVIFTYSNEESKKIQLADKTLTSRQVVVYADTYKSTDSDDELAACLSRDIVISTRSYNGVFRGVLRSLQIKAAPKKFEIVADKVAVDFLVNAGYNPLGLITYIHKTSPQKRYDLISTHNLTSKRLAIIYEYIYTKYPYFLAKNEYLENQHYQNFLLTSQENRKLLLEKIKTNSKEKLKYE